MERPQRPVMGVWHTCLAPFLISAPWAEHREYTDENEPVTLQVVCTERRDKEGPTSHRSPGLVKGKKFQPLLVTSASLSSV